MADLNPRQARFVDEFLVDLNATQAAIRAGYSEKTAESQGSRLLSNAKIADAIQARQAAISQDTKIDTAWVVEHLVEVVERCMQAAPVVIRGEVQSGEFQFDSKGAVSALGQLGKYTGGFIDRRALSIDDKQEIAELASELGLDADEVQAEAEGILKAGRK